MLERHSPALLLANHLPITDLAETMHGEIAHIHLEGDHSVHAVLAPADCRFLSRCFLRVMYSNTSSQARKSSTRAGASGMASQAPPP